MSTTGKKKTEFMRKYLACFLTATFFLLLSYPSRAFEGRSSKYVLDNGLTVLMTEMPSSPVVSVYALVRAGSATEGKFLGTGISHFLEHMLFKGTHGLGVGEAAARIQAAGGRINASTGMDYTMYTVTVPHESFGVALDVLSDMLMNAAMDAAEVERERKVIFGEMRLNNDDPDRKLGELTFRNVYLRHPYRHPVIGYETLLAGVTREDLLEYYRTFYTPDNMILSVAGHFDPHGIVPKISETFKDFRRGRSITRNLPVEPPQISRRRYEEEYPTDLARLSVSFAGVSLLDPDLYALDVLAGILGGGKSSRLYRDLYKKQGLVYSVSASDYTPADKGIFGVDCLLEPENVETVIQAVLDQIGRVREKGVNREELEKAKQQVRSEHVLHHQTASSVAYAQAVDEAFAGDYRFSQKYVDAVGHVTNDDIKRVANAYLADSRLTTVVLNPRRAETVRSAEPKEEAREDIRKHVLANGLTVLLREDHTFPVVSVRLSANGGVRQETVELNGLSRLTAAAWIRGTKRYSANQIAEKTEGLGMRLDSFSGRNSFGLELEFLTEHLPAAFDLLKELTVHPAFPEEEIARVKGDMKAAIRRREDDIFSSTAHVLKETLFLTHPFRLEAEGTVASLDRITRGDVVNFYGRFAVSRNMVLSVFGDINAADVLKDIERLFGNLDDKGVSLAHYKEDPPAQPRETAFVMDKEQAMVMFGFQGPALSDDAYYGIEVLTSILGSSFNGRLFAHIRERLGEAYTLGGDFIPGPDAGLIYFYVLTTDKDVDRVRETVMEEIAAVQSDYVSDRELADMKTYLKGTFRAAQETGSSLSFTVSLDELYGLGFQRYRRYDRRIDEVTRDDIRRLARQYLDLKKAAVVVTRPKDTSP